MRVTVKLDHSIPETALSLFRADLAWCDPALREVDLGEASSGRVTIVVGDPDRASEIADKVRALAARVTGGNAVPAPRELRRVTGGDTRWSSGLDRELVERRWVVELGEGSYALAGAASQLATVFEAEFRRIALELGAEEWQVPSLLPASFLKRIDYFASFPHYTTFAFHLQPDLAKLDEFMAAHTGTEIERIEPSEGMAASGHILSPTVCYHVYNALTDTDLQSSQQLVTASASCYRWESSNLDFLRRLWQFRMREVVAIGAKPFVEETRESAMEKTLTLCERLGLTAWVETANDPFFSPDAASKRAFQSGFGLKWEMRMQVAQSGESIAVASFNNMQRMFGRTCEIRLPGQDHAFSGCAGWGIERWVYAFLAQRGLDTALWPDSVRDQMGGL